MKSLLEFTDSEVLLREQFSLHVGSGVGHETMGLKFSPAYMQASRDFTQMVYKSRGQFAASFAITEVLSPITINPVCLPIHISLKCFCHYGRQSE